LSKIKAGQCTSLPPRLDRWARPKVNDVIALWRQCDITSLGLLSAVLVYFVTNDTLYNTCFKCFRENTQLIIFTIRNFRIANTERHCCQNTMLVNLLDSCSRSSAAWRYRTHLHNAWNVCVKPCLSSHMEWAVSFMCLISLFNFHAAWTFPCST